jgi:hypothetical protein
MAPWLAGSSMSFVDVGGANGSIWLLGRNAELLRR